ncbi:MAG TPA: sulfite exporter TauE/SafE family protein [Rhodanobacter sp.]|nr:sulfite exporter TauE/SafE family protein [Rhodanobacter sp.]
MFVFFRSWRAAFLLQQVSRMLLPVLAILFLATLIRSAFGFGEALVAVPLLAFVMPVELAAPLAVLVSITVAVVAIAQDWRHIHLRSAGWLVLSTLVGMPLGLLALHRMDARIVKAILAVVIMGFSGYSLLGRTRAMLPDDRWAWIFGFAAGVFGGAYGMNGPPLVMYGSLRGWSPQHFRATLQGYFLPASLITFAGYGLTGLWTVTVNRYYLLALPVIVLAIFLGRAANRRMNARIFVCYVHVGLVIVGALLLFQSVAGPRIG